MMLGIGVLLINLHNPVYVAETVATMDVIAGGNMAFGVGLGYRDVEFDAFGVRRGERVKRFVDCLELVKRLWTEESVSFESEHCTLKDVRMNMRPVQKPHPPIWFAANSDPAVKRAAHMGDTAFHQSPRHNADHRAPDGCLPRRSGRSGETHSRKIFPA